METSKRYKQVNVFKILGMRFLYQRMFPQTLSFRKLECGKISTKENVDLLKRALSDLRFSDLRLSDFWNLTPL